MENLDTLRTNLEVERVKMKAADSSWRAAQDAYHTAYALTFKWQPGTVLKYHGDQYLVRKLTVSFNQKIVIVASPQNKGGEFGKRIVEFWPDAHAHMTVVA